MAPRVALARESARRTPPLEVVASAAQAGPTALRALLARARPLVDELVSVWPEALRKKLVVVVHADEAGEVRVEARVRNER